MLTHEHATRLIARGLDPQLALQRGLRSAPDGAALLIDYIVQGRVHNTKIRRGKGNMPWVQTGQPLALWNVDCLRDPPAPDEPLIVTEGELDALALLQAGFSRVVSVPNGAPASAGETGDKRFTYLYKPGTDELLDDVAKFQTIILAGDVDQKGFYLRDALAVRLGDEKCLWVPWPDGCKDANDALMQHGLTNLQVMVLGAKRMWLDHVARLSDIPDRGPTQVYKFGQTMLDAEIEQGGHRLPAVGFVTIAGPANHGKSVFTRQVIWHLWKAYGAPFAITAYEEDAKPTYQKEFRRLALAKDPRTATLDETGWADVELEQAMVIIQRPPGGGEITIEQVLSNVEFAIKVYGVRVVVIDPANEIDRGEQNYSEATGKMIQALKDMAQRYGVLVICVAHPPAEIVRRKKDTEPWTHYDIEGSRHWAGRSDAVCMLWRCGGDTMLHMAKLKRWDEMGAARTLYRLSHDKNRNMFEATARGGFEMLDQEGADKAMGSSKPNGGGYGYRD